MPNLRIKRAITLILIGIFFIPLSVFADYVSKSNVTGAYEDTNIWTPEGTYPPSSGIISVKTTISSGAYINRTGGIINNANLFVNGSFLINGNVTNEGWYGITINPGAYVEIFGDLTGFSSVLVETGGTLIVHGNFTSTGSAVSINGNVLVMGDYSSSSSTVLNVIGNLVVGGDFSHLAGGFSGTSNENLYILDPDAVLKGPADCGPVFNTNYGDVEDLIANEWDNPDLLAALEILFPGLVPFTWVGTIDSDWFIPDNWNRKSIPVSTSNVVINTNSNLPQINPGVDAIAQTGNLTIKSGASLTINPGGKLSVNGDLSIETGSNLVLVNETGSNKLASLITKGLVSGSANINLNLPANQWYYLSSPIAGATLGNFDNDVTGNSVYCYRNKQWYNTKDDAASTSLPSLEGVLVKYPAPNTLNYTGTLNSVSNSFSRTYDAYGWNLFGNPYPCFIDWQDDAGTGWSRPNIVQTMWYRTNIGSVMAFVTYNRTAPKGARAAFFPTGAFYSDEEETELSLIPPMQAVWVRANSATTISVNKEARSHGNSGSYLKSGSTGSSADIIRVVSSNKLARDGAVIYFWSNSTEEMDQSDSEKRLNDSDVVPEVYTRINTTPAAINGLSQLDDNGRTIPLSVRNRVSDEVTMTFDLGLFNSGHSVELEDKVTGSRTNLRATANYTYTPSVLGEVNDRFVIHISYSATPVVNPEEDVESGDSKGITIVGMRGKAMVEIASELLETEDALIEVYTLNGQKVTETTSATYATFISLPRVDAVFVIKVTAGGKMKTEKVLGKL